MRDALQTLTISNPRLIAADPVVATSDRSNRYKFEYLPQLDGLRGVAVVLVIFAHTVLSANIANRWLVLFGPLGNLGVLLFLVLSGFLITRLLFTERQETNDVNLKAFYARRILRLLPALSVFLVVMLLLEKSRVIAPVSNWEFVACLLYARNFYGHSTALTHLWSLSLEEQFYLCWPLLLCALPVKWVFRTALIATCGIAAFRALAIHFDLLNLRQSIHDWRPYFRFDSFLIGACLALALASFPRLFDHIRSIMRGLPVGLLWVALLVWSMIGTRFNYCFFQSIQLILAIVLLAQLVVGEGRWSQRVFRHPVLRRLGKISYALYLWQQLFTLARPASWGTWPTFPVWLLPPLLLAAFSYHFIESPALRLKRRFEYVPHGALSVSGEPELWAAPGSA